MNKCECKVSASADAYEISSLQEGESLNQLLIDRWVGNGEYTAEGCRPLAHWFNKQILESSYLRNNRHVTPHQLDAEYQVLTGEDSTSRIDLIYNLDYGGIDVETVLVHMVSRETMRIHLNDCLSAEKEIQPAQTNWEQITIAENTRKLKTTVSEAMSSLQNKKELRGKELPEIRVEVSLSCPICEVKTPLDIVLSRGYICPDHPSGQSTGGSQGFKSRVKNSGVN